MHSILLCARPCSIYNLTGASVIIGLSAGMDTIAGQAFGAKNYRMLVRWLRGCVLGGLWSMTLVC